jgi:threonine/homoserine efflux transporter RhtA
VSVALMMVVTASAGTTLTSRRLPRPQVED